MVDREYLVSLIKRAVGGTTNYWAGLVADMLIAHGVTVNGVENGTVETVTDCNGLKPKTNLDHVRTLTAEELAWCISCWQDWGGGLDEETWLEWLQAPWDEKTWQKKFFL